MKKLAKIKIVVDNDDDQNIAEEFVEEMKEIAKKFGLDMYKAYVGAEGEYRGNKGWYWSAEARFKGDNVSFVISYDVEGNYKREALMISGTFFGERVIDEYEGGRYGWEDSYDLLKPYFEENKNDILIEIAELQKRIDELKKLL